MFKYKKIFVVIIVSLYLLTHQLYSQSQDETPQKVYRYCYVINSKDWYKKQEELWKSELLKNPKNEDAWYNYFFAARYGWEVTEGQTYTREKLMDSIYNEMGKSIPDSWVYHYIHYYNYATDFSRLEKAYQIKPNSPDLYWEFIKEYTLKGQDEKRYEFCKKLYDSKDISSGIYNLNYNMLNSASENSILFTNGENDTYPAWVLQEVIGVRKDVLILTMHGTFYNREYLKSILTEKGVDIDVSNLSKENVESYLNGLVKLLRTNYPDIAIHFAQTVYEPYYEEFKDKLYLTGCVLAYSEEPFESEELNKEIIENNLKLDYLEFDCYADLHVSEPMVKQLNLMYVEPFIKLADHYYSKGDIISAKKWKNKALSLSKKANDEDYIKMIEDKSYF